MTKDEAFLAKAMGDSNTMGLYINERFICEGPIDKLMLASRQIAQQGDRVSFRAVDDESTSKEHRSGKGPSWDQPISRSLRRLMEKDRTKKAKRTDDP